MIDIKAPSCAYLVFVGKKEKRRIVAKCVQSIFAQCHKISFIDSGILFSRELRSFRDLKNDFVVLVLLD